MKPTPEMIEAAYYAWCEKRDSNIERMEAALTAALALVETGEPVAEVRWVKRENGPGVVALAIWTADPPPMGTKLFTAPPERDAEIERLRGYIKAHVEHEERLVMRIRFLEGATNDQ